MAENIYKKARKEAAKTSGLLNNADNSMEFCRIERTRLLDIEKGKITPRQDEVVAMSEAYKAPELCSYYCSRECPIGKFMDYPKIDGMELPEIAMSLMSAMYFFEKATDTVFGIFSDREISEDEMDEFKKVLSMLDKLSDSSDALRLWAKQHGIVE